MYFVYRRYIWKTQINIKRSKRECQFTYHKINPSSTRTPIEYSDIQIANRMTKTYIITTNIDVFHEYKIGPQTTHKMYIEN